MTDYRMAGSRIDDFLEALRTRFDETKAIVVRYFVLSEQVNPRWIDIVQIADDCWRLGIISQYHYYFRHGHFDMRFPFWRYEWVQKNAEPVDFSQYHMQAALQVLFARQDLFCPLDLLRCRMVCRDWWIASQNSRIWENQCARLRLEPVFYKDLGLLTPFQRMKMGTMCNFYPTLPDDKAIKSLTWLQVLPVAKKHLSILSVFQRHYGVGKVELREGKTYLLRNGKRCVAIGFDKQVQKPPVFVVSSMWKFRAKGNELFHLMRPK